MYHSELNSAFRLSEQLPYSSSKILLANRPTTGTSYLLKQLAHSHNQHPHHKTHLSNVSASRYAFSTNHPIRAKSPKKITQLRNVLQEKSKCITNIAVNSKLDCHA